MCPHAETVAMALHRALAEGGTTVGAVGRIEPSLEDVFVSVVGGRRE